MVRDQTFALKQKPKPSVRLVPQFVPPARNILGRPIASAANYDVGAKDKTPLVAQRNLVPSQFAAKLDTATFRALWLAPVHVLVRKCFRGHNGVFPIETRW